MRSAWVTCVVFSTTLACSLCAQVKGGGSSSPPSTTPSSSTSSTSSTSTTQSQTTSVGTSTPAAADNSIYIMGSVFMDDGSQPPVSTIVELDCGGISKTRGTVDPAGGFYFQPNSTTRALTDASEQGPDSGRYFSSVRDSSAAATYGSCEVRARLAGYRSQSVRLGALIVNGNVYDAGRILLRRMGESEGSSVSAASLAAPKNASKALSKGLSLAGKGNMEQAVAEFEKALKLYPKYPDALVALGRAQTAGGRYDEARANLELAVQGDPLFATPLVALAALSARLSNWKETADFSARAVRMDPFDFPEVYYYAALAAYNLHDLAAAGKNAAEAVRLDSGQRSIQAVRLLSAILAEQKDYRAAAKQLRNVLPYLPAGAEQARVQADLARLETLAAKQSPSSSGTR
jgi:tetratricopeptide (TPR) repeat protein